MILTPPTRPLLRAGACVMVPAAVARRGEALATASSGRSRQAAWLSTEMATCGSRRGLEPAPAGRDAARLPGCRPPLAARRAAPDAPQRGAPARGRGAAPAHPAAADAHVTKLHAQGQFLLIGLARLATGRPR
jgi:hypothetical protein